MGKRRRRLLTALADGSWHQQLPDGIGVVTVHGCHMEGLLSTRHRLIRQLPDGVQEVTVQIRITRKGQRALASAR